MANRYLTLTCSQSGTYYITNTTGSVTFTLSRNTTGNARAVVTLKRRMGYGESSVVETIFSGAMALGSTQTFTLTNTDMLNSIPQNSLGSVSYYTEMSGQGDTASRGFTFQIDSSAIKSQFTSASYSIQSTPLSGYLISGYSTRRINYTATKGTGATSMDFDFSIAYGISGSLNPSSDTSNNSTYNGHTDLTLDRRDSDISFQTALEVRDTRGQTVDREYVTTSWKGYTKPEITYTAYRCESDGTQSESGEYVKIIYSATYSLTSIGNTGSVTCKYGGNTYTSGQIIPQARNVARTYTLEATDTVLNSRSEKVTKSVTINTAKFPLDLIDDRTDVGARVGAIAERGYFTCGLKQRGVFFYGTCSTARATARKVVSDVHSTFQLYEGVLVFIKFTNANGKANPTLNINGTGAIAIKRYGTTAPSTSRASSWNAGSVVAFIYDGTQYQMVGWINTTYSAISQANIEATRGTSSGLITGQRFTQGFDARFSSAFTNALTKSAIYSVLGANTEETVHLGGMSAYSTARNKLRINIPIPTGATISVAIDSGYTSWQIASSSANQTVTVSSVSVVDNDISSATIEVTLTTNALTSERAYAFKNGQIKMTCS